MKLQGLVLLAGFTMAASSARASDCSCDNPYTVCDGNYFESFESSQEWDYSSKCQADSNWRVINRSDSTADDGLQSMRLETTEFSTCGGTPNVKAWSDVYQIRAVGAPAPTLASVTVTAEVRNASNPGKMKVRFYNASLSQLGGTLKTSYSLGPWSWQTESITFDHTDIPAGAYYFDVVFNNHGEDVVIDVDSVSVSFITSVENGCS